MIFNLPVDEAKKQEISISWRNAKNVSGTLIFQSKFAEEIAAILGTKIQYFNRAKINQIQIIAKLYTLKRTAYDSSNEDHERKLLLLWHSVFPHSPLSSRISSDWSLLGFQGKVLLSLRFSFVLLSFYSPPPPSFASPPLSFLLIRYSLLLP